ncbi:MAG: LytTR family DNA-binding domain-containing protein [Pseudorhodobacter sp.]|nr:LytTR family DNA-binding domain-containing protein [Pseudorhodobacter sp.]
MTSFIGRWKEIIMVPAAPVTWAALTLLGAVAGPFGTLEVFSLGPRAVFWSVLVAFSIALGTGTRVMIETVFGIYRFRSQAPFLAAVVTLVLTPLLVWLKLVLRVAEGGAVALWGGTGLTVFVAAFWVSAIRHALALRQRPVVAPAPSDSAGPRLLARLPLSLQAPLQRLSVNDHYVEVVTAAGCTSVLMRLADAIAETDGVDGMQVHRSHWVAYDAVRGAQVVDGKPVLLMADGAQVPVSRSFRAKAKARGLLDGAETAADSAADTAADSAADTGDDTGPRTGEGA